MALFIGSFIRYGASDFAVPTMVSHKRRSFDLAFLSHQKVDAYCFSEGICFALHTSSNPSRKISKVCHTMVISKLRTVSSVH